MYILNRTEFFMLQNLEKHLDELYSEENCKKLRKLIICAIYNGYVHKKELKEILALLPMTISKTKFLELKATDDEKIGCWPEYADFQYEHYIHAIERLQRIFSSFQLQNLKFYKSFGQRNKKKNLLSKAMCNIS